MDVVLFLGLIVLSLLLLRRYLIYRDYIRHLAESLEVRQSYLFEGESDPSSSKDMQRLTEKINSIILENAQLKQARANHLEQLEATLSNMLEGAIILDGNNHILMVNNALRNSFRDWIGQKKIVGQRFEVLFSSSSLLSIISKMKAGEVNEPVEIELIQGSDRRWVRVSGALMGTDSPDREGLILLIFYEITRQKELEVVRREFVANVSHELRTPVTIIKGYVDTLLQDFEKMPREQRQRFLAKLGKNVDRMHDLLMDLLSLAKIESSQPGPSLEAVSLHAFIRQILANFMDQLEHHKMGLELALSEKEIVLKADSSKLEQVFENLLQNAIKYTPENSTLHIGTELVETGIKIWVEDNGKGIPEADLPRIFERFYRVEKGRSRDKGGTGLGLSIVKRIISFHGGTVKAENAESGGLRISIWLPAPKND